MDNFITLTDGTRLEVKINFGTIYYLTQCGGSKLMKKIQRKQDKKCTITDFEQMELSAKIIYAILRSNGKKVTFDEALELVPPDVEDLQKIIDAFEKHLEKSKKKETSKKNMKVIYQK
ncbi:hypothetical protein [Faecalimonas sp.]